MVLVGQRLMGEEKMLNTEIAYGHHDKSFEMINGTSIGYAVPTDLYIESFYKTTTDTLKVFTEHRFG